MGMVPATRSRRHRLRAILARHHDVEDHKIDPCGSQRLHHRGAVLRNGHAITAASEKVREERAEFLVVVDDQNVL